MLRECECSMFLSHSLLPSGESSFVRSKGKGAPYNEFRVFCRYVDRPCVREGAGMMESKLHGEDASTKLATESRSL